MNIFLWVLQILLALHTVIGAVWKFSNSAGQTMPSLKVIPDRVWRSMALLELLFGLALILPAFSKSGTILAPIAAVFIALEMLLYCGLHISTGYKNYDPIIYWLVVAAISVFIAFGRFVIIPF